MVLNIIIKASKKGDNLCNREQQFVFKVNFVREEMVHQENRHPGREPTALLSSFSAWSRFPLHIVFLFVLLRFSCPSPVICQRCPQEAGHAGPWSMYRHHSMKSHLLCGATTTPEEGWSLPDASSETYH